jgi:threonine/homoserine/homoserine lactone efflux protein
MDFTLLATGVAIGLSVTAPLGPVNIIVIRTVLRRNMWVAVIAGMGAVTADAIYAIAAAYGVRSIEQFIVDYARLLMVLGGTLLVATGIRLARSHVKLADLEALETPSRRQIMRKVLTTFMLTLTNPGIFFGFLAIFGTMSSVLKLGSAPYRPMVAVLGVALGGMLWWLFLSYVVEKLKSRISVRVFDHINRWTGILIAGFGFALLMEAVF